MHVQVGQRLLDMHVHACMSVSVMICYELLYVNVWELFLILAPCLYTGPPGWYQRCPR